MYNPVVLISNQFAEDLRKVAGLKENDLIDTSYESSGMMRKITFIFCDSQGGRIENLLQSKKNVKSTKTVTHRKKELQSQRKISFHPKCNINGMYQSSNLLNR